VQCGLVPKHGVEQNQMSYPLGMGDGERNCVRPGGVVTDKYGAADAEFVKHSRQ
jgi:hypothetical protein